MNDHTLFILAVGALGMALAGCAAPPPGDAAAQEAREDTPTGSNIVRRAGASKVIVVSPEAMRETINNAATTGRAPN